MTAVAPIVRLEFAFRLGIEATAAASCRARPLAVRATKGGAYTIATRSAFRMAKEIGTSLALIARPLSISRRAAMSIGLIGQSMLSVAPAGWPFRSRR